MLLKHRKKKTCQYLDFISILLKRIYNYHKIYNLKPINFTERSIFDDVRESMRSSQLDKCFALLEEVNLYLPKGSASLDLLLTQWEEVKRKFRLQKLSQLEQGRFFEQLSAHIDWLEGTLLEGKRLHSPELLDFLLEKSTFKYANCPSCASTKITVSGTNEIQCFNCGASENYFIPSPIQPPINEKITKEESRKIEKLLLLCRHELILKRFDKAMRLCKEAIEIGFDLQEIWEYHALCYFYNTDNQLIINNSAREILADLTTSNNRIVIPYQDSDAIREVIANGLSASILKEYESIERRDESQRNYLIHLLEVWQVCFSIFPNVIFIKRILFELIGKGKFSWFEFNSSSYTLKSSAAALAEGFDSVKQLKSLLSRLSSTEDKLSEYTEIIQLEVARELNLATFNRYFYTLRNHNRTNNFYESEDIDDVLKVLNFLQNWEYIYEINENPLCLDLIIRELTGQSKICWFDMAEDGSIQDKPLPNELGYAPYSQLLEWSTKSKKPFLKVVRVVQNHLSAFIHAENEELARELPLLSAPLDEDILEMLESIFLRSYQCYLATEDKIYLELPLELLTEETNYIAFYALDDFDIKDNYPITASNFSLVAWLKELCQLIGTPQWNMLNTVKRIHSSLVNHHFRGIQTDYNNAVYKINSRSSIGSTELSMIIKAIKEALSLFEISEDPDHLLWAIEEMSSEKGSLFIWLFQNVSSKQSGKNGGIIINKRLISLTNDNIFGIWEDLIFAIQTQLPSYQSPTLKKPAILDTLGASFFKNISKLK